jgi:serine/threonine protein kinase
MSNAATIEILRGELERLFTLEEMTSMSQKLLGLDPQEVGGESAKASFARALTERCMDGDRIEALVDVILVSRSEVDPRVRDIVTLLGKDEHAAGKEIGGFNVVRKIGESDLGIVYLTQLGDKPYALKVLRREASRDRRAVHRFLTANRLVATVEHPGLPKGLGAGELPDGTFYVSYEFVEGQSLAARLGRTGPLHINELKPLLRGILEPLAALHKAHMVHGDLKLENVLAGKPAADTPKVTLIDFGTDRLRQRSVAANGHTGLLAVFGSPKTAAPELIRGKAADSRSDVYAFGCMMYELLSGKPVFVSENATDAAFAHLSKEAEAPSTKGPRGWITKDVDAFVLSLLHKDPARRPKDAQSLFETLEAMGRPSTLLRASKAIAPEKVDQLIDMLVAAPDDSEAAIGLE